MGQGRGVDTSSAELRPPRHRVSRRAIAYWSVRAAVGWLVLAAVQGVPLVLADDHPGWLLTTFVLTLVVGTAHVLVMPQWRFRVHRWEATPEAVYTQAGWFNQERRVAPVSRIQTVDSERGPFEQLFGITKVTITTASAAGPLTIHGLDQATAAALVDELTANTQATREDGT
jgi:membrane protein YdbS with pleckstrin-like domain